jgi:hypothetical protein
MKTMLLAAATLLGLGMSVALAQGVRGGPNFVPQQYGTHAFGAAH